VDDVIELLCVVDSLVVGSSIFWLREGGIVGVDLLTGVHQILVVHVRPRVRHSKKLIIII